MSSLQSKRAREGEETEVVPGVPVGDSNRIFKRQIVSNTTTTTTEWYTDSETASVNVAASQPDTTDSPPLVLAGGSNGCSREEFERGCYLMHGLGYTPSDVDDLLRASQRGDECGRVDFALPLDGMDSKAMLLFDWDGEYFHDINRLPSDVSKTERMLSWGNGHEDGVRPIVFRAREPKSPKFPTDDPALHGAHIAVVTSKHPGVALTQMTAVLSPLLPEPFKSTLLRRANGTRVPALDKLVDDAWLRLDELYQQQRQELEDYLKSGDLARRLLSTGGVKCRIVDVVAAARGL
eukprot:7316164-Prymnesium_polylepis.1